MSQDEQVEAVARAICAGQLHDPDEELLIGTPHWVAYLDQARAAIEALSANTVVPASVIDEMYQQVGTARLAFDLLEGLKEAWGKVDPDKAHDIAAGFARGTGGISVDWLIEKLGPHTGAPDDAEYLLSLVGFLQAHHVNTERLERIAAALSLPQAKGDAE